MKHNISRLEYNRNHEGEVVSIFLAVSVSNETDSSYYEHWLSGEEMASVLLDEANLKSILEKCYAEAELKMENDVATRPMPSINVLEEEGKKEELETLVKVSDITKKKTAIVAERLAEEAKRLEAIENSKLPEEPMIEK